jgi:hypothetical protein
VPATRHPGHRNSLVILSEANAERVKELLFLDVSINNGQRGPPVALQFSTYAELPSKIPDLDRYPHFRPLRPNHPRAAKTQLYDEARTRRPSLRSPPALSDHDLPRRHRHTG